MGAAGRKEGEGKGGGGGGGWGEEEEVWFARLSALSSASSRHNHGEPGRALRAPKHLPACLWSLVRGQMVPRQSSEQPGRAAPFFIPLQQSVVGFCWGTGAPRRSQPSVKIEEWAPDLILD